MIPGFKILFYGGLTVYVGSRVIVPLIRWGYGYEDKTTPEYKDKVVKKFLEDTKEKKVIPNSNGENWF